MKVESNTKQDNLAKCIEYSGTKDGFGHERYYPCPQPAKYKVTYKSSTSGKVVTSLFCKKHLNALNKNAARIKKLTGFDSEISIKEL